MGQALYTWVDAASFDFKTNCIDVLEKENEYRVSKVPGEEYYEAMHESNAFAYFIREQMWFVEHIKNFECSPYGKKHLEKVDQLAEKLNQQGGPITFRRRVNDEALTMELKIRKPFTPEEYAYLAEEWIMRFIRFHSDDDCVILLLDIMESDFQQMLEDQDLI